MQHGILNKTQNNLSLTIEALKESFSVIKSVDFVSMIIRFLRMVEMKDPRENIAHASRVSFYSLAIFNRYCQNNKIDATESENQLNNYRKSYRRKAPLLQMK